METAEGDTACERAYNGVRTMATRLEGSLPADFPAETDFLPACNELPPATQQCLEMSYGMAHREECQAQLGTPEARAFQRRFRRRGGGGMGGMGTSEMGAPPSGTRMRGGGAIEPHRAPEYTPPPG